MPMKGHFPLVMEYCALHQYEKDTLPLAESRGWPMNINFQSLEGCIEALHSDICKIIQELVNGIYFQDMKEYFRSSGSSLKA
jgi:hypothetical protein